MFNSWYRQVVGKNWLKNLEYSLWITLTDNASHMRSFSVYISSSQSQADTTANWRPCLIPHWQSYFHQSRTAKQSQIHPRTACETENSQSTYLGFALHPSMWRNHLWPLLLTGIKSRAWISNYIHKNKWCVITHSCLNFNGGLIRRWS